jgi:LEA14-like dessication related protein
MLRSLVFSITLIVLSACHAGMSPELRVLGIHEAEHADVVFVQVTNPASKPMRLTKLEYVFAAGSAKLSEGELVLSRDIPAGAAVVVEVPLEVPQSPVEAPVTLRGKLTAELDQIVQIFRVSTEVATSSQVGTQRAPE